MQLQHVIQASGNFASHHSAGIDHAAAIRLGNGLSSAIAAFKEVQIHRSGGIGLIKVRFEPNPSLPGCPRPMFRATKRRPSPGSVDHRPGFKDLAARGYLENGAAAIHRVHGAMVSQRNSALSGRFPQGLIEFKTGHTHGGRRYFRL